MAVRAQPLALLARRYQSTSAAAERLVTEYDQAKPYSEIPGPSGLPYIGTMLQYRAGPLNKYNIDTYQESVMSMYHQYGKIAKETIAGTTHVHLFDPDYFREVLSNEGKMPYIAPLMQTTQLYRKHRGLALGLGNTNGEEWYRLRSAVQQMMMRPKAVTVYLPFVTTIADDFIQRLKDIRNEQGHVPNLRNEISKWNVESAAMTVFETRLNSFSSEDNPEVQRMIDANADMFTVSARMKFRLPLHKLFKTPSWKKLVAAEEAILQSTERLLNEAVSKMSRLSEAGELQDGQFNFLAYLLGRKELTDKDVTIITLSLFGDGLSTTSPTLASILYCISRHEQSQDKLYKEISRLVPQGEQLTPEMINSMSYLKAVIKEAFRFFPIGLEVTRVPQQNMVIGGYQIPAGSRVELNNYVMLQDPEYFKDPDEFIPERWLRDGSAHTIHPYILTPFGVGPRMCAGRRFAEQEMMVVIVKILQNFRLEWKHRDMGQKYQILMVPDAPVNITFHNRS